MSNQDNGPDSDTAFSATRRVALKLASAFGLAGVATTSAVALLSIGKVRAQTNPSVLTVKQVNGQPTYNGASPGPTFTVSGGDVLDIELVNDLPALHDDCTDNANNFHGLNTTNLHTHGLHVSPTTDATGELDADNVFVSVTPLGQAVMCDDICGESVKTSFRLHRTKYRFELPANHPSGTFWYHAHKHGSTARQVGAGLSGPLIVQDQPGSMPPYIEQANEKILMIMNRGLVLAEPGGGGESEPTITMRPGEVQRWRIINAQAVGNSFAYLTTDQAKLQMYQIAFDGLTLPKRVLIEQGDNREPWLNPAALAPGNRMDLIVRAPIEQENSRFSIGLTTGLTELLGLGPNTRASKIDVKITGAPIDALWSEDDSLPGPGFKPFDAVPLAKRAIDFTPRNTIDGGRFDGAVAHQMELGTEEEWTISNSTQAVHAFHIHVNPFFITHINGRELEKDDPLRRWQDTIGIPYRDGATDGSITYKTRFETFKGKFVIHCHVLRHEDLGMMQTVEVI